MSYVFCIFKSSLGRVVTPRFSWLARSLLALSLAWSVSAAPGQPLTADSLKRLTFDQNLNAQVPLDATFLDEHSQTVPLSQYLGHGPAILALGYYECPMLCNLVLNGIVESLQEIKPSADENVSVIFVSINPSETPVLAQAKKKTYLKRFGRHGTEDHWHFLCGRESNVRRLADSVGFHYAYDPENKQYAHPSGIVVLTPEGKVSRYFFGVTYPSSELRSALAVAASRKASSPVRQLLILCSQFVPLTGKFSAVIMGAVRALAILTVLALAAIALISRRKTALKPRNPPVKEGAELT